jgi:rhodanese-related sulfurtransferase
MKRIVLSVVLATSFVSTVAFAGEPKASVVPELTRATIGQVIEWSKTKAATPVDCNDAQTREKFGVIPGAVLLSSTSEFKLTELPADKATKLVFYCANASCKASDSAARRAQEAGYTVTVLNEGIMGWKKAGQANAKP